MAEIVNLNRFRKARERDAKEQRASVNRARFGRAKDERTNTDAAIEKAEKALDDKKLD